MTTSHGSGNDVAIIGVSGRFPRARNVEEFWANLRGGVECISRFTADDLTAAGIDPAALRHPAYVNAGGVVDDIDLFDADFFGFNAREAEITDPQQRLFLECAWQSLEEAGYDPARFPGLIGVFGGVGMSRYLFNILSNPELMATVGQVQIVLGNDKDHLTTRVAYKLNLKGPAITVQTACSTSLVAVALAYQSLIDYQCDMALAGGVTIAIPQKTGYVYQPGSINSPDGHCRVFDAAAMGTVGGDGVATVLLKRYEDAIADRDAIHAVIKGAALNNDGSVKVGYTAPSIEGQAAAIATAQAIAGVHPETISYIEAHGTGTPLGDPIELAALTQVFRASTRKKRFCAIGSVKSNIGHLDCAAGVAGLIKTVLALEHREIPASLHFQHANPKIDFDNGPFHVSTALTPWEGVALPRRAGVSSFGIGGTNAHVVLEEAPASEALPSTRTWTLLPLSARTPAALDAVTANIREYLERHPDGSWPDIAYTCAIGRRAFACRRAVAARDIASAIRALAPSGPTPRPAASRGPRKIAFLFPGQGAQHPGMGQGLLRTEPVFREELERCATLLRPHLGFDLRDALYPASDQESAAAERLQETAIAQPALFAIEYALARLLQSWGIQPQAMIGHSIGEFVAACLADVFSLDDALALVARRGQLMQAMPRGGMLAVSLSLPELQPLLDGSLDVAALNAPSQCVLSGPEDALARAHAHFTEARVPCHHLRTSHAFHSRMMTPAAEQFVDAVVRAERKAPSIPFMSNVTGDWISAEFAVEPTYWARQLRQPVRLADGMARLLSDPETLLVEVGPGVALSTLARQHPARRAAQPVVAAMRHPKDVRTDDAALADAIGQLWTHGVDVDWTAFHGHEQRRRVHLPTYPFERQRYWIDARRMTPAIASTNGQPQTLRKPEVSQWFYRAAWDARPLPSNAAAPPSGSSWLLFRDDTGVGDAVDGYLRRAGVAVTTVRPGTAFAGTYTGGYTIDPKQSDDYTALLADIERHAPAPTHIVHLWTLTPDQMDDEPLLAERGFSSLLSLAQALARRPLQEPRRLLVVSNGLHAIEGETLSPEKALVIGPVRVIPQEHPNIICRSIDITVSPDDTARHEAAASLLIAECIGAYADAAIVAWRGDARFVQRFEAAPELAPPVPYKARAQGVYLITGGMGGIGLALAEHLSRDNPVRLVLVGRSGPGDRARARIEAIEKAGSTVMTLRADVSNRDQMGEVVAAVRERFGAVHGVIHAAGIAGGGMLQRKTAEAAARVLAPKVAGTLLLDDLLRDEEALELFVLCSSLSSAVGGFGQVDYCAANAFLDAFAHERQRRGRGRTISIGWDTWREAGMAVDTEVPRELMAAKEENLKLGLTNREGADVFARAMAGPAAHVLISTTDLNQRVLAHGHVAPPPEAARQPIAASSPAAEHPRPALDTPYEAPRSDTERVVSRIWSELLGISPVGVNDDFFAAGGHSLLAIQVVSRLREAFHVEVPVHVLFDSPTVARLSAYVDSLASAAADGADGDHLESVMSLVEQLSDDEVRRMLDERAPGDAPGPPA